MRRSDFVERFTLSTNAALVFRDIQNATNQRTFITSMIPSYPSGNKVPHLSVCSDTDQMRLVATCNSFVSDSILRRKMSQGTVNWFYVEEVPLPKVSSQAAEHFMQQAARALSFTHPVFAPSTIRQERPGGGGWRSAWAVTVAERLRLRSMLDALLLNCTV